MYETQQVFTTDVWQRQDLTVLTIFIGALSHCISTDTSFTCQLCSPPQSLERQNMCVGGLWVSRIFRKMLIFSLMMDNKKAPALVVHCFWAAKNHTLCGLLKMPCRKIYGERKRLLTHYPQLHLLYCICAVITVYITQQSSQSIILNSWPSKNQRHFLLNVRPLISLVRVALVVL